MFNQFKKFITLMLCAALLNACVLPSTTMLAVKSPLTKKQQDKPSEPQTDPKEKSDEENPTMQESWRKVIKFEWKALTKADAWNIGKSVGGTIFTLAVV